MSVYEKIYEPHPVRIGEIVGAEKEERERKKVNLGRRRNQKVKLVRTQSIFFPHVIKKEKKNEPLFVPNCYFSQNPISSFFFTD